MNLETTAMPPLPPVVEREPETIGSWLRDRFFSGVFIVVPVALLVWLMHALYSLINQPADAFIRLIIRRGWMPAAEFFRDYCDGTIPGAGLVLTVALILVVGIFIRNYVGQRIVKIIDGLLRSVPVLNSIYQAMHQVVEAFQQFTGSGPSGQRFNQVVLVPISAPDSYSIGFLTGRFRDPSGRVMANVFVPTPPNPLNGLLLVAPIEKLIKIDYMTVEEVTKMIISLGLITPQRYWASADQSVVKTPSDSRSEEPGT